MSQKWKEVGMVVVGGWNDFIGVETCSNHIGMIEDKSKTNIAIF